MVPPPPPKPPISGSTNSPISATKSSHLARSQSISSSSSSSPGHTSNSKPLPARVRKGTLQSSPKMSPNVTEELERERAKVENLKALVTAAEEREADAIMESKNWRSKFDELVSSIDRLESQLSEAHEAKSELEILKKELERSKSIAKESEREKNALVEEYESSKAGWIAEEAQLKSKLTNTVSKFNELQKQVSQSSEEEETPEQDQSLASELSPAVTAKALQDSRPDPALTAALESANREKATADSKLEKLQAVAEQLKNQLADLERVNEQLMDDNESYQILVGEKTLMGGFDIKALMRANDFGVNSGDPRVSSESSLTSPSLAGVEEEEEEEDEEDEIEKAVLESQGAGSRSMGAVEAGITKTKGNKRGNKSGGGLDLAAELAQAEENEEASFRVKKAEDRKKSRKEAKEKDLEIKKLQDANKALVLYISKILDRIQAHEGFEKVLSNEYEKGSPKVNAQPAVSSPNAASSIASIMSGGFLSSITKSSGPELKPFNLPTAGATPQQASSAANPAGNTTASSGTGGASSSSRSSWLQALFGNKSSGSSSGIKPLKLGTGQSSGLGLASAGLSGGWTGVKEISELDGEEGSEEVRRREREIAELKLHGLVGDSSDGKPEIDRTIRANRRSTSMYGAGGGGGLSSVLGGNEAGGTSDKERRRRSGDLIGRISTPASPPALTPVGMMKRVEEREKESKTNLSKGQASGFTEIEIRGHRLRPSPGNNGGGSSGSSSVIGNTSPIPKEGGANSQSFPSLTGGVPLSPGIKDLKMAGSSSNSSNNSNKNENSEGILARTAKRISMMRS